MWGKGKQEKMNKKEVIRNLKYFRRCLGTLTSDILHMPPFCTNLLRIRREPIRGALKKRDERSRLSEVIKVFLHSITLVTARNNFFHFIHVVKNFRNFSSFYDYQKIISYYHYFYDVNFAINSILSLYLLTSSR